VAHDAVFAQVIGGGQGGIDHVEVAIAVAFLHGGKGLAGLHHLTLNGVHGPGVFLVRAEDLDHRIPTDDVEILDHRELFNLVQEHLPLAHRAGDHHAGETGHGHFVDAAGEVHGLIGDGVPIDVRFPNDHGRPDGHQNQPDSCGQANPNFHIGDASHALSRCSI